MMLTNEYGHTMGDHRQCQAVGLDRMAEPGKHVGTETQCLRHRVRLVLRRSFSPAIKRKIKHYLDTVAVVWFRVVRGKVAQPDAIGSIPVKFNPGDQVRVRRKDQIQATLNHWNELKGCSFLPEMWQYCETIQKVLKPVKRFVDERDCRVKSTKGVYLLEGVMCQGFELYGACDRACLYFWREEWLEKVGE